MGSRTLPTECKHGRILDWGDFGPDPDDGSFNAESCSECESDELYDEGLAGPRRPGRVRRSVPFADHVIDPVMDEGDEQAHCGYCGRPLSYGWSHDAV